MKLKPAANSFIVATLLILVSSCTKQQTPNTGVPTKITHENIDLAVASLDRLANNLIIKTSVPGIAVAVVHGDKIIYAKGFGVRNVVTKSKVDPDTVFQLASISKSIASTVVAGEVGRGTVKWDDPVKKYLPDFMLKDPSIGSQVTIADMFSHRSGLPGEAGDELEILGCKRQETIHLLRFLPLNPHRSTYNYTNYGLTIGAQAVAAAAGQSWEDLAHNVLYKPLGMNSTSSRWSDYDKRVDKADLHVKNAKGEWIVSARQPDEQSPASGVSSSVNDMAKWMMLELDQGDLHGRPVIDKKALLRTWEQVIKMPALPNYYGLGMVAVYNEANRLHIKHSGAFNAGASTTFDMLPSEHLGIVVLTNAYPFGIPETLAQEFFDIVEHGSVQGDRFKEFSDMFAGMLANQGELGGKTPPTNPLPGPKPKDIVGTYVNDYFHKVTIEAVDNNRFQLTVRPCSKDNKYILSHWDGNTFSFPIDNNGTILSAFKFIQAEGSNPTMIKIELLDGSGLGTFTKLP